MEKKKQKNEQLQYRILYAYKNFPSLGCGQMGWEKEQNRKEKKLNKENSTTPNINEISKKLSKTKKLFKY